MYISIQQIRVGIIASGQLDYKKFKYLNMPGKVLNVNDITEQIFFQEKKNKLRSH